MDKTEGPSPEAEAVFDALVGGDEKKIRELGIKEIRGLSKGEIVEDKRAREFLEDRENQFWRPLSDPKTKKELLDRAASASSERPETRPATRNVRPDGSTYEPPNLIWNREKRRWESKSPEDKNSMPDETMAVSAGEDRDFGGEGGEGGDDEDEKGEGWKRQADGGLSVFDASKLDRREIEKRKNRLREEAKREIFNLREKFRIDPHEKWEEEYADITWSNFDYVRGLILERAEAEIRLDDAEAKRLRGLISISVEGTQAVFNEWAQLRDKKEEEKRKQKHSE